MRPIRVVRTSVGLILIGVVMGSFALIALVAIAVGLDWFVKHS